MSTRRYLAIVVSVGLMFVTTTAAYVAFLSNNALGRRGRSAPEQATAGVKRPPLPRPARAVPRTRTGPRLPLTGATLEGDSRGLSDLRFPAELGGSLLALPDDDGALGLGVSLTARSPLFGRLDSRGASFAPPGLGGGGGGGPRHVISSGPRGLGRIFPGDGSGGTPPTGFTGSGGLPNVIPEPSALLIFGTSAAVVTAALRLRRRGASARSSP